MLYLGGSSVFICARCCDMRINCSRADSSFLMSKSRCFCASIRALSSCMSWLLCDVDSDRRGNAAAYPVPARLAVSVLFSCSRCEPDKDMREVSKYEDGRTGLVLDGMLL
jgi:hypothetical protein